MDMTAAVGTTAVTCQQEGCPVAQTGICLENISPTSRCPHALTATVSAVSVEPETGGVEPASPAREIDWVPLSAGIAVQPGEISGLELRGWPVPVLVAGQIKSGKTTLFSAMYDGLQLGQFDQVEFVSSGTLLGFEIRVHPNRLHSGRDAPDTLHSRKGSTEFLHLALTAEPGQALVDLLLADVSGELFRDLCDGTDPRQDLSFFDGLCHLAIVVDGEKVRSYAHRQSAILDAKNLLERIIQDELVGRSVQLQIVVTKYDLLTADRGSPPDPADAESFVDSQVDRLAALGKGYFETVSIHKTASRSENPGVPRRHNLEGLLRSWCTSPTAQRG